MPVIGALRAGCRVLLALVLSVASMAATGRARAQRVRCEGSDQVAAEREERAGLSLLRTAVSAARRDRVHARRLAREAIVHFDLQCEAGDVQALAHRGAALLLIGDAMRSAQSYDAFLRGQGMAALDADAQRRLRENLQPGRAAVRSTVGSARLFVDGLDFGPLPRDSAVRLPAGRRLFEARDSDGTILARATISVHAGGEPSVVILDVSAAEAGSQPPPMQPPDFVPWYVVSGATAALSLGAAIGLLALVAERERTHDAVCAADPPPGYRLEGCDTVLLERDFALGGSVAGFVLSGLALVALGVAVVLDVSGAGDPEHAVSFQPRFDGQMLSLSLRH